jgi:hypothetical protein
MRGRRCKEKFQRRHRHKRKNVRDRGCLTEYSNNCTYLKDSLLSRISAREGDECITTVLTCHGVHNKAHLPYLATLFKQRDQLIFIHVTRDFATKYLKQKVKYNFL